MNHEAPLLLDAIARAVQVHIDHFTPQQLANTAWSFATMNHKAPLLFESIARALQVRIDHYNAQDLAIIAWSFAVFDIEPSSFTHLDSPLVQTLLWWMKDPSFFIGSETILQLHQFQLWCQEQKTTGGSSWRFRGELSRRVREVLLSTEEQAASRSARLQNDIVAALGKLPDVNRVEVNVSTKSGYIVDAVVTFRGERIGVQVDGPFHFVGQSQTPNGSTILKRRQVRSLENLKLISVPYWEWEEIDKRRGSTIVGPKQRDEKKQTYLQHLLEKGDAVV
jgi:RAP domain